MSTLSAFILDRPDRAGLPPADVLRAIGEMIHCLRFSPAGRSSSSADRLRALLNLALSLVDQHDSRSMSLFRLVMLIDGSGFGGLSGEAADRAALHLMRSGVVGAARRVEISLDVAA